MAVFVLPAHRGSRSCHRCTILVFGRICENAVVADFDSRGRSGISKEPVDFHRAVAISGHCLFLQDNPSDGSAALVVGQPFWNSVVDPEVLGPFGQVGTDFIVCDVSDSKTAGIVWLLTYCGSCVKLRDLAYLLTGAASPTGIEDAGVAVAR